MHVGGFPGASRPFQAVPGLQGPPGRTPGSGPPKPQNGNEKWALPRAAKQAGLGRPPWPGGGGVGHS